MDKNLPSRPNLDHLRRQAKSLLAALETGDADAVTTILEHLPAAKGMSASEVRKTRFRLADAQSAVARKSGFANWPRLARHVEQLRALEGTWGFARLELDGSEVPPAAMQSSRLLIDGDRFRCESPEADYEGIFNIDVEAQPHKIEIEFVEGPEAGNWNYGIFRIEGGQLEICLDMNGKPCPASFGTTPGSGHAYETLKRLSGAKPESVTGGTPQRAGGRQDAADADSQNSTPAGFDDTDSPTIARLQGEWSSEKLVLDGKELPAMMRSTGRRTLKGNRLKISFGGQTIIDALVRIDELASPACIDYYLMAGASKGAIQRGIMEWRDDIACFCMSAPNAARPDSFECAAKSGRTLSHWRRVT